MKLYAALALGVLVIACAARILMLGARAAATPETRADKRRAINRTAGAMLLAVGGLVVVEVLVP